MFGFFKGSQRKLDDQFKKDLYEFAQFFALRVEFLNPIQTKEIVATVTSVYLERDPEDEGSSVADFFFNSLVGNICDAIGQGVIDKHTGLIMWKQSNRFLSANPGFKGKVVNVCMKNWKDLLLHLGVDKMNFDFAERF
ncbi:hypothetical protein [Pseudoalteromonas sp. APC 3694]|uniref:hypothetical protein n=1 Tax=Pseudoalteromonas sp. APC 3694 TaxID=3035202 RepID=UPI0025B54FE0|nr:hypothetical protein [Pseudoalteromonas sp. APC 3694]MDN3487826.1 hypothetical protein [Pseudoalteromonas sp. APC 3694]